MENATFVIDDSQLTNMYLAPVRARPEILQAWGSYALRENRRRYRACVAPDGTPWTPTKWRPTEIKSERVNPKTGQTKRAYQDAGSDRRWVRTLYGRGDLFRSMEMFRPNRWTVGVGSNLIYAKTHQFGASFTANPRQSLWLFYNVFKRYSGKGYFSWNYRINIPARPFLGLSESDRAALAQITVRVLERYLRRKAS